ncbi:MAG: nitrate- and nitrite sensing domain-containing protein [Mycobacteriales bacterium]
MPRRTAGESRREDPPPGPAPRTGQGTGLRRRLRGARIRTKIIVIMVVPAVAIVIPTGLRTYSAVQAAAQVNQVRRFAQLATATTTIADALQTERGLASDFVAAGRPAGQVGPLRQAMARADAAAGRYRSLERSYRHHLSGDARAQVIDVDQQLGTLRRLRAGVLAGPDLTLSAASFGYTSVIAALIDTESHVSIGSNDRPLVEDVRAATSFSRAKEFTAQEQDKLIAVATHHQFEPGEYRDFAVTVGNVETSLEDFTAAATGGQRDLVQRALPGDKTNDTAALELRALQSEQVALGITRPQITDTVGVKLGRMRSVERQLDNDVLDHASALGSAAERTALTDSGLVLVALLVAIAISVLVAGSMVAPLRRLRSAALLVARQRLPDLVRRLERFETVRADDVAPPLDADTNDEIGQVAQAFNAVHAEAVRGAVEQAELRRNVAQMFVNLARRSQTLVDRQIQLIDQLEQSEREPDRLAELFKVDHLATRMRRNDENLLVLAGEDSARRWTRPVRLVNVLRAAASEVEQYARVELTALEDDVSVTGHAVNDIVHLVAELLENATTFSSPQSKVIVASRMVGRNCMVEIEDQGIGMAPAQLAETNERLSRPPMIDVTLSKTMGLFVVSRLASRHRVKVQLRSSPLGGAIAMVLLPEGVISRPGRPGHFPGGLNPSLSGPAGGGAGSEVVLPGRTSAQTYLTAEMPAVTGAPRREAASPYAAAVPAPAPGFRLDGFGGALLDSAPDLAAGDGGEALEPLIFSTMESEWFRTHDGQSPIPPTSSAHSLTDREWTTPADSGWRAAEAAATPPSAGTTPAGLPVRVPMAQLVPGAAAPPPPGQSPTPDEVRQRSARDTRSLLDSYRQGLERGRAAGGPPDPGGNDS